MEQKNLEYIVRFCGQQENSVYDEVARCLLDNVDKDEDLTIGHLEDLSHTQDGSWLIYHQELDDFFKKNCHDILDILKGEHENSGLDVMSLCKNSIPLETLTWVAFETAVYSCLYELENFLEQ